MQRFHSILIGVFFWLGVTLAAAAETFTLNDGKIVSGEMVSVDRKGVVFKTADGKFAEPVSWEKFSQDDLKKIAEKNPKAARFVEPLIDVTVEEKRAKRAIDVKPVPRLARPPSGSLIGSLFGSSVGIAVLLLLYAANIYAGYEVALFRAQPVALVCGLAAVLPIIGPIIFLSMPTHIKKTEDVWETMPEEQMEGELAGTEGGADLAPAEKGAAPHAAAAAPSLPQTQIFPRGQFTLNRRFFETKFAGFFGVVKREAEKDMVLIIKSSRGTYTASRIPRIASNDIHFLVQKGNASEEITIPFVEIQEVQLKHKDAK